MKDQDQALSKLTQEQKAAASHHESQLKDLIAKMEANHRQTLTTMTTLKQQGERDSDQLVKALKVMITEEVKMVGTTLLSETRFLVEQIQSELQGDMSTIQKIK